MVRFDFKVFCVNFSAYIMSENTKSGQDEVKVNDDSLEEGVITMKQLLEAGVHFGHQSSQWNPAMKEYIYGSRNGIHIIDLQKTLKSFLKAYDFIKEIVSDGGEILFVGTKKQAQEIIGEEALKCDMPFVNSRWLGGTLTNFNTIRSRVDYLIQLKKLKDDGEMDNLPKKEQITLNREMEKLEYLLNGILNMKKMPTAMFVVDTRKEEIAIKEAKKIGIPIVGIVDTNSNPSDADYVIPSNDDAIRAVKLCVEKIANACQEGRHIFMQKVQSGELTAEKVEESDYVVERKAFVFKSNTQDPEQDSVVYAEDENQEKQDS
ncbi:30S ribosomal protein S2 [bacterium]|nr:MAG: 30S ribosomal protein S2 [bacterium]|tara:strand:+ start:2033 stop:2989 length:957 start_codon:yes stop_codon:yes gene_type:complete